MRIELPEIFWHGNRERIMSLDFGSKLELVTAGADLAGGIYLRLWDLALVPELRISHLEDLAGTHERSVNVVRFSPCRNFIASGSDDACVVIWEKKKKPVFSKEYYEVGWGSKKVLRGHLREIHDLCWNHSGRHIASASLDGSVIIYDIDRGKVNQRLEGSKPVHGVAWSGSYLATMSTDRSLRIYEQGKKGFYIKHCIKEHENVKLFQDEVSSSAYFRRCAFSNDGSFLLTSAGVARNVPAVHCFFYENYQYPSVSYPVSITNSLVKAQGIKKSAIPATALSVRFCPIVFKIQKSEVFKGLECKFVWAVACKDAVIVYSSDEVKPITAVTNPHYSSITDVSWYEDQVLAISSIDGYISFMIFEPGELGERLEVFTESSTQYMEVDDKNDSNPPAEVPQIPVIISSGGKKRIVPQLISDT